MAREDSCHGDSGDGEGGLFGRRAAASCGGLQAREPESASAVACGGAGWDEPADAARQIVAERFGVAYHERTIGKILKQIGFSYVSARPRHSAKDEETVAAAAPTIEYSTTSGLLLYDADG